MFLSVFLQYTVYIFLQYIEAAKKTELPLLRLEFAMRKFYFFFFCVSMWVSVILESVSNSWLL